MWSRLRQLQTENDQLRASMEGGGEGGGGGEGERERVQEQMSCILRVIDDGVQSGQLKVGTATTAALLLTLHSKIVCDCLAFPKQFL